MTTKTKNSLARFLKTRAGQQCVAAYIGVRSCDAGMMWQAEQNALHFAPLRSARDWTLADLRSAALTELPSGVYAARAEC
jgi:hypothetical protein